MAPPGPRARTRRCRGPCPGAGSLRADPARGRFRGSPRWEAGLEARHACAGVGPPFAASGTRAGLTLILFDPGTVVVREVGPGSVPIRLNEAWTGLPWKLKTSRSATASRLPATIVLCSTVGVDAMLVTPPPSCPELP